ncbi:malate dehydrogenase [bacterium]|nr:malate dehydrogenase [bacterium]
MLGKIGIVGGGNIGGVLVQEIARRNLAREIGLVDPVPPEFAKGKCLDIAEGTPIIRNDIKFCAGKGFDVLEGSEILINTAGVPRKPKPDGTIPTREELLTTNLKITKTVSEGIAKYCPDATIISIANPLDAIVYTLYKTLKSPKNKIMGQSGALDSSRYRYFCAIEAGVSVENVEAMVLGGHGDTMVPIRSCCRIAGMPIEKFIPEDKLSAIEARTRNAGAEVVKMLGVGSAFVSPAWGSLEMVEAIAYDKKKIMPVCALLEGEYDTKGLFVGIPVVLGKNGVEKIIEVDMTNAEKEAFKKSTNAVQKTFDEVDQMLKTL